MATVAFPAAPPPAKHTTRSTSPRPRWCGGSSLTAPPASPCARSADASTPTQHHHRPANPPGAPPRSAGCCATRPTSAGSTTTAPNRCPTGALPTATGRSRATGTIGSRSTAPESSPTNCSRPLATSPPTTPSGARAAPNPANGCSKASSNAVFAVSAPAATRCAAATAPGTATTTAATTTPSAPAVNPTAAPNATSAPTPWTPSCSTTSAPPSPDPTYSWPANKQSPWQPRPPTTNSSPPNWPGWTANLISPTPNSAASSTSTRAGSSNSLKCSAAPPSSQHAEKSCSTSEPASLMNAPPSPATISSDPQDSRHSDGMIAGSPVGFGAVMQGQAGAGVDGVGVVEQSAEFVDGGGVPWCGERVDADVQGVAVGDDVAGSGQGGADQGVRFIVAAGVAGVGEDRTRQRLRGVERGDADGVVDQFRFGVEDLLAGVDLGERQPGGERLVGGQCRVEGGLGGVHVGVDGVDHRVGEHGGGSRRRRRCGQQFTVPGGFGRMQCPPGLFDLLVGELLGRVGHHPGGVVLAGAVGVVGVEIEMHAGVAVVVLLAPAGSHPVADLGGRQVAAGGQDVHLPGGGGIEQADLSHREHLTGAGPVGDGQLDAGVGQRPGVVAAVFVGVGVFGEQGGVDVDVGGGALAPGQGVEPGRVQVGEQRRRPAAAVEPANDRSSTCTRRVRGLG